MQTMTKKPKTIRATWEVDTRSSAMLDWADHIRSSSSSGGIATTDGGTMWTSAKEYTFEMPITVSGTGKVEPVTLSGTWTGTAMGSGWSGGSIGFGSTTKTYISSPWVLLDDLTDEQREMVQEAILEQIAR
jgi:hypothetical protein